MATTDYSLIKGFDEDGPIRYMNEEEIKERNELNIANTSESLRKRVIEHNAKSNGHAKVSESAFTNR